MLHEIGPAEIGLWILSLASMAVMLTTAFLLTFSAARAIVKATMRAISAPSISE